MVDENELIIPQAFGMAPDAPSPTLLVMANLNELEVEVDVNEVETSKVRLDQSCRISPVAYPEKSYSGSVVEIAPEADRDKGTLEVKVRIHNPDRFLVPELNARVDFLAE
jgi:HlyD family secretion protein